MPFLEEMSSLESKYKSPYDTWKLEPTPKNTTTLLNALEPEIKRGITAHVGQSNPLMRSRARRIALQAAGSYDPTRNAKLGTHIVNQLEGLKRVSRKQTQILRVPERVSMDQQRVERARLELVDRLGRDPSYVELSDSTGLSRHRLDHIRKFKHSVAEGALSSTRGEDSGGFLPEVDQINHTWTEIVYDDLDDINRKILEWTLGLHGEPQLSNQDIARKLRLSPGAISQRKSAIQRILNREDELSPF